MYIIIKVRLGAWYNGSIGVSKTFDGSSILSAPANRMNQTLEFVKIYFKEVVMETKNEIRISNISKDTQRICEIVEQALTERESLIRHIHGEIVGYKLGIDSTTSNEYLQSLDTMSVEQLIKTHIQVRQEYLKKLEETYGVNQYRKI